MADEWICPVSLSRLQFALTTMLQISWAALSIGLSAMLLVVEDLWPASSSHRS